MKTRVYLIPVSSKIFNNKTYAEISDEEFMTTAEENGTVYSTDVFQEKILTDGIDLSKYRFRIITITETVYALFGDEVASLYNEGGTLQQIADEINDGNCTCAVIDESWSICEILNFAQGWYSYATMTEEDYNELIKLLE